MERTMRRKDRQLSQEEAWSILQSASYGVLSLVGDEGWPYAIPINYVLWQEKVYLHCAKVGYKLDCIRRDPRVCFTVVGRAELISPHITTVYESAILTGKARIVEEEGERLGALEALIDTLGSVSPEIKTRYIDKKAKNTTLLCIQPDTLTGKANPSFVPVEERLK